MKRFLVFFFFAFIYLVFHIEVFSDYPEKEREKYWIFFDKKEEISLKKLNENLGDMENLLSERAIKRRKKVRVDDRIIDETDLPVKVEYVNYLSSMDIKIVNTSKWLNGVSAHLDDKEKEKVKNLPFVREVKPVLSYIREPIPADMIELFKTPSKYDHNYDYGFSFTQNNIINVPAVHDLGIVGRNILIGMLDTGFNRNHECLEEVKVLCEWDFINQDNYTGNEMDDPPGQENHGTQTLATIGGFYEGKLIGPAFGSTFALAKTELKNTESVVEEDNWVRGIEWFDSIGVDIVSSSLGYANDFIDKEDYTFSDLDGKTAITTIAAEMAVKKGMVVINSVGNERNTLWGHIISPADGENVIAVGAVGANSQITYFSSPGPTADGRIKPDVVAMGQNIWVPKFDNYDIVFDEYWGYALGTSFSCPITSGAAALVLSAHPDLTPAEVREAFIKTADRANNPDNDYGYGLIDAYKAVLYFGTVFSNEFDIKSLEGKYRIATSIVSPNGIPENSVFLHYKYSHGDGEFKNVMMEKGINSRQYCADVEIPSFGTPIFIYFSALDSAGVETFNPYGAPDDYYSYLSPFSKQLISFSYKVYSRKFVLLNWTMEYETNNLGFDIEKSVDNKNFVKVAHIPGHGTTSTEQNYFLSDLETNTGTYYYRLKKIDYGGFYEYSNSIEVTIESPKNFSVSQNYPNPFNTLTTIEYQISEESEVEIRIYDVLGREIKALTNGEKSAGYYEVVWDGRDNEGLEVSSGTYFYRFKTGNFSDIKKITFLK